MSNQLVDLVSLSLQGFEDEHKLQAPSLSPRDYLVLVWLDYTFPLSYRDIEKMMLYLGISGNYETIGDRCRSSPSYMPINCVDGDQSQLINSI